jgi:dienelactone hydrolase
MRRALISLGLCALLAVSACASVEIAGRSLMAEAAITTLQRPDGPRPLVCIDLGAGPAQAAVIFVTGSGCAGHGLFLPDYWAGVRGPVAVFGLEKPGVRPHDTGLLACSQAFHHGHTHDTRVADIAALVDSVAGLGFARIGLVGVSEGAGVAVAVALADRRVDAVTAIGAGPMDTREALLLLASRGQLPMRLDPAGVERAWQAITADPRATNRRWLGATYAWWASQDHAPSLEAWAASPVPLELVVGSADASWPPEAATALAQAAHDNPAVTVTILDRADHRLDGQHRTDALQRQVGQLLGG